MGPYNFKSLFVPALLVMTLLKPLGGQPSDPNSALLKVPGATIDVILPTETMKLSHQDLLGWVQGAANAVSSYYGRFPVPHLTLQIRSSNGSGIRHGVTYAKDGGLILISVGTEADVAETKDDWVLIHEMIHLAFPSMPDDQHWIEEGISTYVEPVARVRVGLMQVNELWRTFVRDMPKGEPGSGDQGLDNTHTWGRTYWGGAMFCLLADVEIHRRTQNRFGLQDAVRAIARESGGLTAEWPIARVLETGDAAVGVPVLEELYAQMKDAPVTPDLMGLWRKLGVEPDGASVRLVDNAPFAQVRRSIMQRREGLIPAKRTWSSPPSPQAPQG